MSAIDAGSFPDGTPGVCDLMRKVSHEVGVESAQETWEYNDNDDEKTVEAKRLKESGTAHFQAKEFVEAMADYKAAAELAESEPALQALWVYCKFNIALICVNLNDFPSAVTHAGEVFKKNQLLRRGEKASASVTVVSGLIDSGGYFHSFASTSADSDAVILHDEPPDSITEMRILTMKTIRGVLFVLRIPAQFA